MYVYRPQGSWQAALQYVRAHGDELHVHRLEEHVAGVADPYVAREVHEIEGAGAKGREEPQGQLTPQRPVEGEVAHHYGCRCTYSHTTQDKRDIIT